MDTTITAAPPTARMLDALQWLGALAVPGYMGITVTTVYGYELESDGHIDVSVHARTDEQLRLVRRHVGPMDKVERSTGGLLLEGSPCAGVKVTVWPPAGTCELVETGEVEEYEEVVEPAKTRTATRPKLEWKCPESILGEDASASQAVARPAHVVTVEGSPPSEPMLWTAQCSCGDSATAATPGMAESALAGHEQGVMPVEVAS